ncbi:hypothetical protein [Streptosporangium sp. NPDC051022]|uniref:hypothetical protein n=1 Tax=Streptosporangium sp. NPDC051022 TaxID=3155752 RepID=UPI00342B78B8
MSTVEGWTACGAVSEHGDVCASEEGHSGLCRSDGPRKHVSAPEKAGKPWCWYRDDAVSWNADHPVGAPVRYWPGWSEGEGRVSRTRTPAWTLGSGEAVVSVEGYPGGIALTHVEPIPASVRPQGGETSEAPA